MTTWHMAGATWRAAAMRTHWPWSAWHAQCTYKNSCHLCTTYATYVQQSRHDATDQFKAHVHGLGDRASTHASLPMTAMSRYSRILLIHIRANNRKPMCWSLSSDCSLQLLLQLLHGLATCCQHRPRRTTSSARAHLLLLRRKLLQGLHLLLTPLL